MKNIINAVILLFTVFAFAQYPDTTPGSREIREQAKELTIAYDQQLALDGDQLPIFQDKVEDYLVLSYKIKEDLEGKEELDALTELMVKETLDMQDILTRPQFIIYKRIRQDVQPIKVVEVK